MARAGKKAVTIALVLALTGCGGFREKTTETVGRDGYWHLERSRSTFIWTLLNRIGFISKQLSDHGYRGERWWYVSPAGERRFMRLLNAIAPDSRDTDPAGFISQAVENARIWGFTGFGTGIDAGAWLPSADKLPSVVSLSLDKWNAGVRDGVFEQPAYGQAVAKACEMRAGTVKDSPAVLGVLWESVPLASPRQLLLAYAALKPDSLSKRRLVTMIRDQQCRNDPKALAARLPSVRTFDELLTREKWDQYESIDADAESFARIVFAAYGGRVQEEVRSRFPNYLNLGPLLDPSMPVSVIQALAAYVDVLTFAVRSKDGRLSRRYFADVNTSTGKPIMILEYGARLESGQAPAISAAPAGMSPLPPVRTPEGLAHGYRRGALASAAIPFCVGFGWTGYRDLPSEASGFLDMTGTPRVALTEAAVKENAGMEEAHKREFIAPETVELFAEDRFLGGKPAQAIARLPGPITVDGDLRDWPATGFVLRDLKQDQDLDGTVFAVVHVGWNDRGVAIGVGVEDTSLELLDPRVYWKGADFIELFLDGSGRCTEGYSSSTLHLVILPRGGGPDGSGALVTAVHHEGDALLGSKYDYHEVLAASSAAKSAVTSWRGSSVKLSSPVWVMEAVIPWSLVQGAPKPDSSIGFNLIVHRIANGASDGMFWSMIRGEAGLDHPSTWGMLTLKEMEQ